MPSSVGNECASNTRPKIIDNVFPIKRGARLKTPTFSAMWAAQSPEGEDERDFGGRLVPAVEQEVKRNAQTRSEPLDDDGRH
jgi:hypothetical protein